MTTTGLDLLTTVLQPLTAFAADCDDERGWTPTALPGWTVRDLLFHLLGDVRRGTVALATPGDREPDTDDVSYWADWTPGTDAAATDLRMTRIHASTWPSVRAIAADYVEAARALLVLAARADPDEVVATQGHALRVDALLRTLAVEATVHHLDLAPVEPGGPSAVLLGEVRRVLDALLGSPAPVGWDDARWVRLGTGRAEPTAAERAALGVGADRLPLFG